VKDCFLANFWKYSTQYVAIKTAQNDCYNCTFRYPIVYRLWWQTVWELVLETPTANITCRSISTANTSYGSWDCDMWQCYWSRMNILTRNTSQWKHVTCHGRIATDSSIHQTVSDAAADPLSFVSSTRCKFSPSAPTNRIWRSLMDLPVMTSITTFPYSKLKSKSGILSSGSLVGLLSLICLLRMTK